MKAIWLYVFVLSILSNFQLRVCTLTINGSVSIHSLIFDKVINAFEYVLVKFDEPFSYGDKEDVFKEISRVSIGIPNLLTASVGIADYGEKENADLAERFGITKSDYPAYRLFHRNANSPIVFSGEVKADPIKMFIVEHTGAYIGLEGCLEDFDRWAKQFAGADTSGQHKEIFEAMSQRASELQGASAGNKQAHGSAEKYLKIAQKIQENGIGFVKTEQDRLRKLSDGNISDNKKLDIKLRLNILQSFSLPRDQQEKLEL